MPLNGLGTYTPPAADFPAVAGTLIEADKWNNIINDISTALSLALYRDGQAPMTAPLDMNDQALLSVPPNTFPAADISFAPTATIAATAVQAAIAEVDTEYRAAIATLTAALLDSTSAANGAALVGYDSTRAYTGSTIGKRLNDILSSIGSTLVGFIQAGVGAIARTLQAKVRESVTVADFGALGDGSDATTAIQAALTASKRVGVGEGIYLLSATLVAQADTYLYALGLPEKTIFVRTTAYGDTIQFPAGSVVIKGIRFEHTYTFNNGATYVAGTSTNVTNKDPTSAHVAITSGNYVRITDCWFTNMGRGIELTDSANIWIERCRFTGLYDELEAGLQASVYSVICLSGSGFCSLLEVHRCYFTFDGYKAPSRNITTGSATVSHQCNAGPAYGLYIQTCEGINVSGNYFGGHNIHSINVDVTNITAHVRITKNFFDGARQYAVRFAGNGTHYANQVVIAHNTYVGYGIDKGFLWFQGVSTFQSAARVTVANNIAHYCLEAAMKFERVKGLKLSGNQVAAYNSDGSTTSDASVQSGAFLDSNTNYADSIGNTWGGSVTSPGGANNCKWGVFFSSTTDNSAGLERSAGLGMAGGSLVGGLTMTYPT